MFLRDPGSSPFDDLCYDCDDLDVTIFCQLEVASLPLRSFDLGRFTILALGWNSHIKGVQLRILTLRVWDFKKLEIQDKNKNYSSEKRNLNKWTAPMSETDVGDGMCWWQVWDMGDWFGMLMIDLCHQQHRHANNFVFHFYLGHEKFHAQNRW